MKECAQFLKMLKLQQNFKDEGSLLYQNKKYEEAVQTYNECSKLDLINYKFNSTLYYNKGLCLFEMKQYDECILAFDKCIRLNDCYIKAYIKRGDTYMIL